MALSLWHLSELYRYTIDHAIGVSYKKIAMISPPLLLVFCNLLGKMLTLFYNIF